MSGYLSVLHEAGEKPEAFGAPGACVREPRVIFIIFIIAHPSLVTALFSLH